MQYQLEAKKRQFRQALQWLSDIDHHSAYDIEKAAQRFDLSPLEEEFLLRHFLDEAIVPFKSPE